MKAQLKKGPHFCQNSCPGESDPYVIFFKILIIIDIFWKLCYIMQFFLNIYQKGINCANQPLTINYINS